MINVLSGPSIAQALTDLLTEKKVNIHRWCTRIKLRLKSTKTKTKSYEELVSAYKKVEKKYKAYVRCVAKRKFPSKFRERDFPGKRHICDRTYKQLMHVFKTTISLYTRAEIKGQARRRFPSCFREKDFPRKIEQKGFRKSYIELVSLAENSSWRRRYILKKKAKELWPDQFKDEDFTKTRISSFKLKTYQDYVNECYKIRKENKNQQWTNSPQQYRWSNLKQIAKHKFPKEFKETDYPRIFSRIKYFTYQQCVEHYILAYNRRDLRKCGNTKKSARDRFPDEFREKDFLRRTSFGFASKLGQIVEISNETARTWCKKLKIRTKHLSA